MVAKVRVLAVADEIAPALDHAAVRRIAPDLVLAAGDLPWHYVEFLASAADVPVVFVPGNHDPEVERIRRTRKGIYVSAGVVCDSPRPHGAVNADGLVVEAAGLRIAGLGGCVRYNNGPNQYSQRQYAGKARALRRRARKAGPVDVLLTHAPPRHLGDEEDDCHVGIEALHDVLDALEPSWHLHGHIHPYGHAKSDRTVGTTTLRNVIPYAVLAIEPRSGATGAAQASARGTMVR